MTVMLWLSIVNLSNASALALMSRKRCFFPEWKVNFVPCEMLGVQVVSLDARALVQLKKAFRPLIRLLSLNGCVGGSGLLAS